MICPLHITKHRLFSRHLSAAAVDTMEALLNFPFTLEQMAKSYKGRRHLTNEACGFDERTQYHYKTYYCCPWPSDHTSWKGATSNLRSTSRVCSSKTSRLEGVLGPAWSRSRRAVLRAREPRSPVERVTGHELP